MSPEDSNVHRLVGVTSVARQDARDPNFPDDVSVSFDRVPTIARLESAEGQLGGRGGTVKKIRAALETNGIEFIEENGGGPEVRLRKRHQKRG